jgi:hypothetical protein
MFTYLFLCFLDLVIDSKTNAPEKLEYLEQESHALWTTLEDGLYHEGENKSSTR